MKALFVYEIFTFLSWLFFVYVEKSLDKKTKVKFKIYDAIDWTTNDYNTHCPIAQEIKAVKFGQLIEYNIRNIFFQYDGENEAGRLQTFLCFFKKNYIRYKQVVTTLVLIYFGRPRLGCTIKTDMLNFDLL